MPKIAVITGASSGIGQATVQTFLQRGHRVVRIDLTKPSDQPANTYFYQADISDAARVRQVFDQIESDVGPIDCLVNSAGIGLSGRIASENIENWEKVLRINALGTFYVSRMAIEKMMPRKSGTLVTIGSIAGYNTFDLTSVYAASKHAMNAFNAIMRAEMAAHGIRCVMIAPGDVETPINSGCDPAYQKEYDAWIKSIEPILKPQEVAEMIYWAYNQPKHICIRELIVCPTRMAP